MRRGRAKEIGSGLGAVAFLLLVAGSAMASGRWSAAIVLWVVGWLISYCGLCVASQFPLREVPTGCWALMVLGLVLGGVGVLWTFIYHTTLADPTTATMMLVAMTTLAVGRWVSQRAAEG